MGIIFEYGLLVEWLRCLPFTEETRGSIPLQAIITLLINFKGVFYFYGIIIMVLYTALIIFSFSNPNHFIIISTIQCLFLNLIINIMLVISIYMNHYLYILIIITTTIFLKVACD